MSFNTSIPGRNTRRSLVTGFTLVELLVVIAIIGLLAALLIPAVQSAVKAAKVSAITIEISNLSRAMEAYKKDHFDYPPNFDSRTFSYPANFDSRRDVKAHMKKAFPRSTYATRPSTVDGRMDETVANGGWGPNTEIDAAEALVFWLSRTKNDVRDPWPGDPFNDTDKTKSYFDFEETRLKDTDNDGFFEYYPPNLDAPYVYFEHRLYSHPTAQFTGSYGEAQGTVRPMGNAAGSDFLEPGKFQIFSAGLDDHYGGGSDSLKLKSPQGYAEGDHDNLANFSGGKTMEDHLE